jgi:hypothetical protein
MTETRVKGAFSILQRIVALRLTIFSSSIQGGRTGFAVLLLSTRILIKMNALKLPIYFKISGRR